MPPASSAIRQLRPPVPACASFGKYHPFRAMGSPPRRGPNGPAQSNDQVWTYFVTGRYEIPEMLRLEAARPLQAYSVSTSTQSGTAQRCTDKYWGEGLFVVFRTAGRWIPALGTGRCFSSRRTVSVYADLLAFLERVERREKQSEFTPAADRGASVGLPGSTERLIWKYALS